MTNLRNGNKHTYTVIFLVFKVLMRETCIAVCFVYTGDVHCLNVCFIMCTAITNPNLFYHIRRMFQICPLVRVSQSNLTHISNEILWIYFYVHRGCNIVPDCLIRATDRIFSFMFIYVFSYICQMLHWGVQCNLLTISIYLCSWVYATKETLHVE